MTYSAAEASWPVARAGELLRELASRAGLSHGTVGDPTPSVLSGTPRDLALWLETACQWMDIEAESVSVAYPEVGAFLRSSGPAIVRLEVEGRSRLLAVIGSRRGKTRLLSPELRVLSIPASTVHSWVCARLEARVDGEVQNLLDAASVPPARRERVRRLLLEQRLGPSLVGGGAIWILRPWPGASFREQAGRVRIVSRVVLLAFVHALQYVLFLLSWAVIGRAALEGRIDRGWLAAWVLMLLSLVPLRMLATWLQGTIALRLGGVIKQRLLAGALRLEPEEIRHQGAGQLLGRVLESEALESLAISGGFLVLLGAIELVFAASVLSVGAGSGLSVLSLLAWVGLTCWLGWRYFQRRESWTADRLDLTHRLVETMLGYQTRLAQEGADGWHEPEDVNLNGYFQSSVDLDRASALLVSLIPRGWMVLGVLGLIPALVLSETTVARLAIGLGGILLSFRALQAISVGMAQLFGSSIAWSRVEDMFRAAARPELLSPPQMVGERDQSESTVLMEGREISYVYPDRGEPVIKGCDIEIKSGDRILLQGPSGGGKSTLAALIAGLRLPSAGLILLEGLDQISTGSRFWRRSVVLSPQFHENHILSESLAFNVLLGRSWPPTPEELAEAEEVCRALGLGDLLDRMPGEMFQMVGDTGWRLSHGERARVFVARTILQGEKLTILDESLESLDSENALRASQLIHERMPTVLAIAHS